jgi:hypothetical protein
MVTRSTCLGFGSHAKPGLLWSKTDAIPTHLGSGNHAGPKCFGSDTYASPMVLVFGQPNLLGSDTQVIWVQHGCQIQVKVKKTTIPPLQSLENPLCKFTKDCVLANSIFKQSCQTQST